MRFHHLSALTAAVAAISNVALFGTPRASLGDILPNKDANDQLAQLAVTTDRPECGRGSGTANGRSIAYYQAWNLRTRSCDRVSPPQIALAGLTHLNLAFATIDPKTFRMGPENPADMDVYRQFTNLKKDGVQTWLGVGGWEFSNEGATRTTWSDLVSNANARRAFIASAMSMLADYGFQGLDIDWEWPASTDRGGRPEDTNNQVLLLKELREALGSTYGLTCVLPHDIGFLRGLDVKSLSQYVDWFNVLTYDLHGAWDAQTAELGSTVRHHTNLAEIDAHIDVLWASGVDPSKFTLGLAYYGRGYTLIDPSCSDFGCSFSGPSSAGSCSNQGGILSNCEIKRLMADKSLRPKILDDPVNAAQVSWNNQWVGFDTPETIARKKNLANERCMGGTAIWGIDYDSCDIGASSPVVPSDLPLTLSKSMTSLRSTETPALPATSEPSTHSDSLVLLNSLSSSELSLTSASPASTSESFITMPSPAPKETGSSTFSVQSNSRMPIIETLQPPSTASDQLTSSTLPVPSTFPSSISAISEVSMRSSFPSPIVSTSVELSGSFPSTSLLDATTALGPSSSHQHSSRNSPASSTTADGPPLTASQAMQTSDILTTRSAEASTTTQSEKVNSAISVNTTSVPGSGTIVSLALSSDVDRTTKQSQTTYTSIVSSSTHATTTTFGPTICNGPEPMVSNTATESLYSLETNVWDTLLSNLTLLCQPPCTYDLPPFHLSQPTTVKCPPVVETFITVAGGSSAIQTQVSDRQICGSVTRVQITEVVVRGGSTGTITSTMSQSPITTDTVSFWPLAVPTGITGVIPVAKPFCQMQTTILPPGVFPLVPIGDPLPTSVPYCLPPALGLEIYPGRLPWQCCLFVWCRELFNSYPFPIVKPEECIFDWCDDWPSTESQSSSQPSIPHITLPPECTFSWCPRYSTIPLPGPPPECIYGWCTRWPVCTDVRCNTPITTPGPFPWYLSQCIESCDDKTKGNHGCPEGSSRTKPGLFGCGCGWEGLAFGPGCKIPKIPWSEFDDCGLFGCDPCAFFGCPDLKIDFGWFGYQGFCIHPDGCEPCPAEICGGPKCLLPGGCGPKPGPPPMIPADKPDPQRCDEKQKTWVTDRFSTCTYYAPVSSNPTLGTISRLCTELYAASFLACDLPGFTTTWSSEASSVAAACTRSPLNLDDDEGDNEGLPFIGNHSIISRNHSQITSRGSQISRSVSIPTLSFHSSSSQMSIPTLSFRPSSSKIDIPTLSFRSSSSELGIPTLPFRTSSTQVSIPTLSFRPSSSQVSIPKLSFRPSSVDSSTQISSSNIASLEAPAPVPTEKALIEGGIWKIHFFQTISIINKKPLTGLGWTLYDSNGHEAGKGEVGLIRTQNRPPEDSLPFDIEVKDNDWADIHKTYLRVTLKIQLPHNCVPWFETETTPVESKDIKPAKVGDCRKYGYWTSSGDVGCDDLNSGDRRWAALDDNGWQRQFDCHFNYLGIGKRANGEESGAED